MRSLSLLFSLVALLCITSCNRQSVSNVRTSPGSARVSAVYDTYEAFAPRINPKASDNTIYVVNFWATWCGQCRKEIPHMVELDKKYRKNPNVKVLFVNVDEASRLDYIPAYMSQYGIEGEVVSLADPDQGKWIDAINKSWSGSLPGTLFIKGKHRKFYDYPMTYGELERNIGFMKNKK